MATLERRIPDTFPCEPRSPLLVGAAKLHFVDNSSVERELFNRREAASRRDMYVSDQSPALKDLCLIVCHACSQVVTAQGILTHYGSCPVFFQ